MKKQCDAQLISARVMVKIDVRSLIEEQVYLKLPDACEIVIDNVDWEDSIEWMDNDLEHMPVVVEVKVTE